MDYKAHNITCKGYKGKNHIGSRVINLGLIFLFLCGLMIVLYPVISNELARYNTIQGIEDYKAYSANLGAELSLIHI